jgi:hypothetical protein
MPLAALAVVVAFAAQSSPVAPSSCFAKSAEVRPRSIVIACGDGNFYFDRLEWTSWTATRARGRGAANLNDCDPTCVAGHFHRYPATVTLSQPKACHGRAQFSVIRWRYRSVRPEHATRSGSSRIFCIP